MSMTHGATTSAPCVIFRLVFSCSTPRAELIEVSAEFSAKLPADFVAARCDHHQRRPKNWRRERFIPAPEPAIFQSVTDFPEYPYPGKVPRRRGARRPTASAEKPALTGHREVDRPPVGGAALLSAPPLKARSRCWLVNSAAESSDFLIRSTSDDQPLISRRVVQSGNALQRTVGSSCSSSTADTSKPSVCPSYFSS